jgi:hypothetical protein
LGFIDLRLACGFGLLDRKLGIAEQFFRILASVHQRDADRAFDPDLQLAQFERCRYHLLDSARRPPAHRSRRA